MEEVLYPGGLGGVYVCRSVGAAGSIRPLSSLTSLTGKKAAFSPESTSKTETAGPQSNCGWAMN